MTMEENKKQYPNITSIESLLRWVKKMYHEWQGYSISISALYDKEPAMVFNVKDIDFLIEKAAKLEDIYGYFESIFIDERNLKVIVKIAYQHYSKGDIVSKYPDNSYSVVRLKNFFELRYIFHNFSITIDTKQGSYYFNNMESAAMFFGEEENLIIENVFAPIDGDIKTNGKHIHIGVAFVSSATMDRNFKVKSATELIEAKIFTVDDDDSDIDDEDEDDTPLLPYPDFH